MKKNYINKHEGTDIISWLVIDLDSAKGTARAIEVAKDIYAGFAVGGFSAIATNLDSFCNANPILVAGAEPFDIIYKDGVWGRWIDNVIAVIEQSQLNIPMKKFLADNPNAVLENGKAVIYERTKSGKVKRHFEKMGQITDTCHYYYDYNF